jgi:hypothetical protein
MIEGRSSSEVSMHMALKLIGRPTVLLCLLALPAAARGQTLDPAKARREEGNQTLWYDIRELGLEGQGWSDTKAPFDRLPAKAESLVRPQVWSLSQHSTGLCVRFVSDAANIQARWTLTSDRLAMPHMAATGVSGLDLYVKHDGRWRWLAVGQPRQAPTNTAQMAVNLPPGSREYTLYLPLYNGVSSVELGLPAGSKLAKAPARQDARPIVCYGTSITQGGCASRTGMVHTAILGRWLDCPVINLGFSGNGKMEPELAELMAELDPSVYVLDCLPNMSPAEVAQRVPPFVETLRKARRQTPIVLVEDRNYTDGFLISGRRERNEQNHAELRAAFDKLVSAGVENLHYLSGGDLLGRDGEATVDGSHPTDLGFLRQAEAFQKVLAPLLGRK